MASNSYSAVAAGTGTLYFEPRCSNPEGLFQVTFNTGCTGTCTLSAKIGGNHEYVEIATITGDDLIQCIVAPAMKLVYSTSGGTFEAGIWEAL